jgi:hypothetical protein
VDSTTTRWIPWQTRRSASSMIAEVVAATSHTVVTRAPALAWCGTRVQTMPDALPTSIAATRARISSCSSTSTCRPCGTDPPLLTASPGGSRGCPGARWEPKL